MITINYIYDRKKVARDGVPGAIEMRITDRRKSWYIATGVKCMKDEWQDGMVVNRVDAMMMNRRLRTMADVVGNEVDACIVDQRPIDVEAIKRKLSVDIDRRVEKIADWMRKELPLMHLRPGTLKHYESLLHRLEEYGELIGWQDMTPENICRWDDWLHSRKKMLSGCAAAYAVGSLPPKEGTATYISDAAVYSYHKCMKALLARAERYGKLDRNPYSLLRGEFKKGERHSVEYLTVEEMAAFENLHPVTGSQMAVAKDMFVWQMHTGMSYSDVAAFDFGKCRNIDGRLVYMEPRVKTGVEYVVQLDAACMDILSRNGNRVPTLSNGDYNRALKALGMAAGITTRLHSHLARHTFATYMLSQSTPLQNVARMLGHTNTIQTQRYAKVLAQSVLDDFTRVEANR